MASILICAISKRATVWWPITCEGEVDSIEDLLYVAQLCVVAYAVCVRAGDKANIVNVFVSISECVKYKLQVSLVAFFHVHLTSVGIMIHPMMDSALLPLTLFSMPLRKQFSEQKEQ